MYLDISLLPASNRRISLKALVPEETVGLLTTTSPGIDSFGETKGRLLGFAKICGLTMGTSDLTGGGLKMSTMPK